MINKRRLKMKIDDKDRVIISMYSNDPDVSQDDIARVIELSQPSVAVRIRKLKEGGALETQTGINPLKMGLFMAKVDIASTNTSRVLDIFRGCPYFANGFTVSGRNNLTLFFMSEKISSLESIVNDHIRNNEHVTDVDFNIIITSEKDFVQPLTLTIDERPWKAKPDGKTGERAMGRGEGMKGESCQASRSGRCDGCPIAEDYDGWLY